MSTASRALPYKMTARAKTARGKQAARFVFFYNGNPDDELRRLPAKALGVEDLTSLPEQPDGHRLQQLPLPLSFAKG